MADKLSKIINGNVPPPAEGEAPPIRGGKPRKMKYRRRAPRLSAEEQLILLRLHEKGRKPSTIARILSKDDRSISKAMVVRYIQQIDLPNMEVQKALSHLRMRAVESWETAMETGEKFGKHTPAKDLLQATGTIRNDAPMDRLIIVVGNGTQVVGELPQIPAEFVDALPVEGEKS